MSEIKLNISIQEENIVLFKRCIRKLLESTFIVGEKDEKLYAFISRESNRQDISDYLRIMGFDVFLDDHVRIAMLKAHEADEEAVGLKRANVVTFTNEQYHLLLVFWEVYLENLGYNQENLVLRGDLIDKIKAYEIDIDNRKFAAAMELFKRYNLIDFDIKDRTEDAIITLYPSLQFGWDITQFQTVASEYMESGESIAEQEEDEEEDDE
ncbi:DUF4194 domain-containing protein [Lacrimispora sp.]|uniref:DUF4194 domain-containing protein n=1 Tax=Lacrimispora sp. TaxID=2719234 RepID=UPI002FDA38E5